MSKTAPTELPPPPQETLAPSEEQNLSIGGETAHKSFTATAGNNDVSSTTTPPKAAGGRNRVLDALFGIDFRALAVFRIGLAFLVFVDFIGRSMDLEAQYTEWGILPRLAVIDRSGDYWPYLSPYMWTGLFRLPTERILVGTLFFLSALCALLLLFGWKTRWMSFATWALLCAVHTRNPLILHGADDVLRVSLFWGMFVPWGTRFSWDALRAKRTAYGQVTPTKALSVGTAGLLLQIAMVYWFTAALKSGPEWRQSGLAVYYALSIQQYATPVGQFVRQYHFLLKPMTFAALGWESFGPTLVFLPFATEKIRAVVVPLFMAFHLILLNLLLDLGPFPYIATLVWVLFLPPFVWDALARKWVVSVRVNPALALVEKLRTAILGWQNQRVLAYCMKQKPVPKIGLHLSHQMVAAFFIVFVLLWNLRGLDYYRWVKFLPAQLNVVTKVTRIDQDWGLFAPRPMSEDGWYIMPAQLHNRTVFDMFTNKKLSWDRPQGGISGMYRSERWRKYLMNLWPKANSDQRYYYGRYLCRLWNRDHNAAEQMEEISIYYMMTETQPDYSTPKPVKVKLYGGACTQDDAPGGAANPVP